jgi:hypothetical protein
MLEIPTIRLDINREKRKGGIMKTKKVLILIAIILFGLCLTSCKQCDCDKDENDEDENIVNKDGTPLTPKQLAEEMCKRARAAWDKAQKTNGDERTWGKVAEAWRRAEKAAQRAGVGSEPESSIFGGRYSAMARMAKQQAQAAEDYAGELRRERIERELDRERRWRDRPKLQI